MRKECKILAVLSTAAVMTAVTPSVFVPGLVQTAFAASAGWVEEDGSLRYKDSDGYYLTDSWKKKDNQWYYLDEDGHITRSSQVDEYYVDEEGKRVSNQWVSVSNEANGMTKCRKPAGITMEKTANPWSPDGRPLMAKTITLMKKAICRPESWN